MVRLIAVSLIALVFWPASSNAARYLYSGNDYDYVEDSVSVPGTYTTSMSVDGYFEVAAPLAPNLPFSNITASVVAFSFSDGRTSITHANANQLGFIFQVATNSFGQISMWQIDMGRNGFQLEINTRSLDPTSREDMGTIRPCGFGTCPPDIGRTNTPGTWSYQVPEANTATLVGLAVAAMISIRKLRSGRA